VTTKALLSKEESDAQKFGANVTFQIIPYHALDYVMLPRSVFTLTSSLVGRCQSLHQIVPACHVAVLPSCVLVGARYGLDHAVVVRVTKVRNRVPRWIDILVCILRLGWWLDYAVFGRLDGVIGPSCQ
jgi:hypothetical protein